jgi:hypothetical protein
MADHASLDRALRATWLLDELYARGFELEELEEDTPEGEAALAIRAHLAGHAQALRAAGATAERPEEFDFSAGGGSGGGPFWTFDSTPDLLKTAQLLHDLLVRIHLHVVSTRGDGAARRGAAELLAAAAAHAARIRQLRRTRFWLDVKPWISDVYPGYDFEFDEADDGPYSQYQVAELVYGAEPSVRTAATAGEDNRTHAGVVIPEGDASTEAFDEPIAPATADTVLALFLP